MVEVMTSESIALLANIIYEREETRLFLHFLNLGPSLKLRMNG